MTTPREESTGGAASVNALMPVCADGIAGGVPPDHRELMLFMHAADSTLEDQVFGLGLVDRICQPLTAAAMDEPTVQSSSSTIDLVDDGDNDSDSDAEFVVEGVRPALPPPPEVHPYSGEPNFILSPEYTYSEEEAYDIFAILDRVFEKENYAYLVQWADEKKRFIATWNWYADIINDSTHAAIQWIDKWKDEYQTLTFSQYRAKFPLEFTASSDAQCFYHAMRLASSVHGDGDLIPRATIDKYVAAHGGGVTEKGIKKFIAYLRDERVPFACSVFKKNLLSCSLNSASALNGYQLPDGVYVVGAACARSIRHCFVMQVSEGGRVRNVFDDQDGTSTPVTAPVSSLEWILRCMFIRKVERVGTYAQYKKKRKLEK